MPSGARFTMMMVIILFGGVGLLFFFVGLMMIKKSGGSPDTFLLMGVGGITALIGLTPLIVFLRKRWIKYRVLGKGMIVQSYYLDIVMAEYSVNNWRPFLIRSQWHDVERHKLYIFKSGPLTNDPSRFLKVGLQIPVYIDPKNPKHYYMDLESAPGLSGIYIR